VLHPPPLPPRDMYFDGFASAIDMVALNPQPLPPKDFGWASNSPRSLTPAYRL
jgi:hypothetical protein